MTRALLLAACLLVGCEDEFDCSTGGCDAGEPLDAGEPAKPIDELEPIVVTEALVGGGLARVTLSLLPPVDADVPDELAWPSTSANRLLEARIVSTAAFQGADALIPYLRVDVAITSLDDGSVSETPLVPMVGIARGIAYGRTIALPRASGYDVTLTIRRPAFVGESDRPTYSPGIVLDEDFIGSTAGTLFGERDTTVRGAFTLR